MAILTRLETDFVPKRPAEAEELDPDWFLELFVDVTEVADVAEVRLLATAAKVSSRLTAEASEAVRFGSDTDMFELDEFLFSALSMGTSEDRVEPEVPIGGGGGGGKAGGGVTLKSSGAEKSKSLDKPFLVSLEVIGPEEVVELELDPVKSFFMEAGLRFLELDLGSSPRFIVSTK
jgi:hypothetical protein